ncbi:DUF418 domain-containing protein [Rhizorhapis sp.]|uniref:DUF418 domain-containing protein n=1 Tax=Rhizorhapis sp. TaxID=1968842 RepID=UPI002B491944|nr:DUF418 domain-containing protein [Rhizorhapis sp.]HKR16630.1 DUF418 domain-containing protein [Rhizorhapis sp.]
MHDPARLLTLDAMRGFAVMGIVLMNIIAFSMPDLAYINPLFWGGETVTAYAVWAANFILVDGKMRGLFSLLFGASTLLIYQRSSARGEGLTPLYRRFFWLFLLGLVHYIFIWWGDILRLYAIAGVFLLLFVRKEASEIVAASIFFFLVQFAVLAALSVAMILSDGGGMEDALAQDVRLHQGSYWPIVEERLGHLLSDQPALLILSGFEALGFMLLGMSLMQNGFLTGEWGPGRYLRVAAIGYLAGGVPMLGLAAWCWASGFDPIVTFNAVISWSLPFRLPLTLAHAALLMWLILRFSQARLLHRVAAAGRTAFTNYVGTSILMTTLFYGYGLDLYGTVDRASVYAFVPLAWVLMLLWPLPWLKRFRYGPFEWVWRSLTQQRWEPMRRG